MSNNLEKETLAFQERFMSHVPSDSKDISLAILKGHLLAEEILADYISIKIKHSEHLRLEKNHWGFANKVELASALASDKHHDVWVWNALKKLNSLRNKLSHGLEPKGLDNAISEFKKAVKPYSPSQYKGEEVTIYGYVLFTVSGLFVVVKAEEGLIA